MTVTKQNDTDYYSHIRPLKRCRQADYINYPNNRGHVS